MYQLGELTHKHIERSKEITGIDTAVKITKKTTIDGATAYIWVTTCGHSTFSTLNLNSVVKHIPLKIKVLSGQ